jgi:hypothetical protein
MKMTPQEAEKLKAEIVWEMTNSIAHMKKSLFGPSRTLARQKRRASQKWLKPLKLG